MLLANCYINTLLQVSKLRSRMAKNNSSARSTPNTGNWCSLMKKVLYCEHLQCELCSHIFVPLLLLLLQLLISALVYAGQR